MLEIGGKEIPATAPGLADVKRWAWLRMKRVKAPDPSQLLKAKENPKGREIVAEPQPEPRDIVFQERRPDGFVGTDCDLMLRSNWVRR